MVLISYCKAFVRLFYSGIQKLLIWQENQGELEFIRTKNCTAVRMNSHLQSKHFA